MKKKSSRFDDRPKKNPFGFNFKHPPKEAVVDVLCDKQNIYADGRVFATVLMLRNYLREEYIEKLHYEVTKVILHNCPIKFQRDLQINRIRALRK